MDSIDFKSKRRKLTRLYVHTGPRWGVSFNEIFYLNKWDLILVNQPGKLAEGYQTIKQYPHNKELRNNSPHVFKHICFFSWPNFLTIFSCLEPEVNRMKEPQISLHAHHGEGLVLLGGVIFSRQIIGCVFCSPMLGK